MFKKQTEKQVQQHQCSYSMGNSIFTFYFVAVPWLVHYGWSMVCDCGISWSYSNTFSRANVVVCTIPFQQWWDMTNNELSIYLIWKVAKQTHILTHLYLMNLPPLSIRRIHFEFKGCWVESFNLYKKASEYDQDISQSHTADQPTAPCWRATEQGLHQDIRMTVKVNNKLALPHQDDCKTRMTQSTA